MAAGSALHKLCRDRRGAVAVEYGFLIALIVLVVMIAVAELAQANLEIWTNVADQVTAA